MLKVYGTFNIPTGAGTGKVLTSDANGNDMWQTPAVSGGITTEFDPTVPANIKDGIDWTEVTNKPVGFPGAFSHVIGMFSKCDYSNISDCGNGKSGILIREANYTDGPTPGICMCYWR